jgi:uncharacterized protein YbjT (DUF2867 family)
LGAGVVSGDLDNPSELAAAFEGAYGVFSVQNFWLPNVGFEGEVRQGEDVADAAKAAGVQHFVFSSVGAAHRGEGQKHFESKYIIEQYIQSLDIPYTILRPVAFMENALWNREKILDGLYPGWGLPSEKTVQTIAVQDIAAFTAIALANPEQYLGQTLEIAGDELTESQMAERFSQAIGRQVKVEMPEMPEGANPSEEDLAGYRFFSGEAYTADIQSLREVHPGLLDYRAWLDKSGWSNN